MLVLGLTGKRQLQMIVAITDLVILVSFNAFKNIYIQTDARKKGHRKNFLWKLIKRLKSKYISSVRQSLPFFLFNKGRDKFQQERLK